LSKLATRKEALTAAYYDCVERTPPPERLAELIERLAQWLEAQNSKS
jgi:hypothetical protein